MSKILKSYNPSPNFNKFNAKTELLDESSPQKRNEGVLLGRGTAQCKDAVDG